MKIIWYIIEKKWLSSLVIIHISSILLLIGFSSPYWTAKLEKEPIFNKPTIHFQRAGEWVEFQILESF